MPGKVSIRPTLMIRSAAPALSVPRAAPDAAQAPAHPAVQRGERGLMAMLEILKPAPQGPGPIAHAGRPARPVRAPGLGSYGRSDSCAPGSAAFFRHEPRPLDEQVSRLHAPVPPAIPSPTTCGRSVSPRHASVRWIEPGLLPHGITVPGVSHWFDQ